MSILFYFILSYYYFLEFYFIIRDRKREKESSGWAKMTGGGQGWTSGSHLFTPEICFHEDSDHYELHTLIQSKKSPGDKTRTLRIFLNVLFQ